MINTICYKDHTPESYNIGVKWDDVWKTFTAYYVDKTVDEAQEEVNFINNIQPAFLPNGKLACCATRTYFVKKV